MLRTTQTARSHRTGALNLDSTWWREFKGSQRPQPIGSLSKGKFAFHPHLVCKSWHLWKNLLMKFFCYVTFFHERWNWEALQTRPVFQSYSFFEKQQLRDLKTTNWNCTLYITRLGSLFRSIRVYMRLHFLSNFLES